MPPTGTKFSIGTCRETKQNVREKINVFKETKRYSPSVVFFFLGPQKKNRTTKRKNLTRIQRWANRYFGPLSPLGPQPSGLPKC
jgi:hypothetical protein